VPIGSMVNNQAELRPRSGDPLYNGYPGRRLFVGEAKPGLCLVPSAQADGQGSPRIRRQGAAERAMEL